MTTEATTLLALAGGIAIGALSAHVTPVQFVWSAGCQLAESETMKPSKIVIVPFNPSPNVVTIDTQEKADAYGCGGYFRSFSKGLAAVVLVRREFDPNVDSLEYEPPPCPECGAVYVEVLSTPDDLAWSECLGSYMLLCQSGHRVTVGAQSVMTWATCGKKSRAKPRPCP